MVLRGRRSRWSPGSLPLLRTTINGHEAVGRQREFAREYELLRLGDLCKRLVEPVVQRGQHLVGDEIVTEHGSSR
jgi:hypothetical protein